MARYRAIVEYDGTDFAGFQRQAQGRTVQAVLEEALRRIGWTGRSLLAAGRTDAGVHAAGQVIAFDLDWVHGTEALVRALNANLPQDVAAMAATISTPGFHPRFDAKARRYRYTIDNAPIRSALRARYTWHVRTRLDIPAMQSASRHVLGTHDFATFGTDPDDGQNTVRTVSLAAWSASGDEIFFDIQAEAFLYRMVRSLVGALRQVGAGELTAEAFGALLEMRDRSKCPALAPPQGLCLMEVLY